MAVSKKRDVYADIRVLQLTRAVAFLIGAVVVAVLLWGKTLPLNVTYVTKDSLASDVSTVFVPALRNLLDVPVGLLAALALAISGFFGLYRYTKGESDYKKSVNKSSDNLKWIDLGVSSSIIISLVALTSGVADAGTIKIVAGLLLVTAALGWLADKQNVAAKKPDYSAFGISVLSGLLAWVTIVVTLICTTLYGEVRLPWFSYALAGVVFVGFAALAINQLYNIQKRKQWKQYPFTERNYLLIDIVLKVAFVAILTIGLRG